MTEEYPDSAAEEAVEHDDQSQPEESEDETRERFEGLEPGAGCTEIWEHLSEQRDS